MTLSFLISRSLISSELLYYSWNDLKVNYKFFFKTDFNKRLFDPVSKKWFKKTSLLIRTGKFLYGKNASKTASSLTNLKFKIIENAFLKLLEPCFDRFLRDPNFDLIEYLR